MIAVPCERIKMSSSVLASEESPVEDIVVGTIRQTDATIIRDDMMVVRVLLKSRRSLP